MIVLLLLHAGRVCVAPPPCPLAPRDPWPSCLPGREGVEGWRAGFFLSAQAETLIGWIAMVDDSGNSPLGTCWESKRETARQRDREHRETQRENKFATSGVCGCWVSPVGQEQPHHVRVVENARIHESSELPGTTEVDVGSVLGCVCVPLS